MRTNGGKSSSGGGPSQLWLDPTGHILETTAIEILPLMLFPMPGNGTFKVKRYCTHHVRAMLFI